MKEAEKIKQAQNQKYEHENKMKQLSSKTKQGGMKSVEEQKKAIVNDKKKCQQKLADAKKRININ